MHVRSNTGGAETTPCVGVLFRSRDDVEVNGAIILADGTGMEFDARFTKTDVPRHGLAISTVGFKGENPRIRATPSKPLGVATIMGAYITDDIRSEHTDE